MLRNTFSQARSIYSPFLPSLLATRKKSYQAALSHHMKHAAFPSSPAQPQTSSGLLLRNLNDVTVFSVYSK